MNALALLVEEMKNEDTEARINAMKKLRLVATVIGPERTRRELIPYLNEQIEDDDEVLLVMADELGYFVPLVGGPTEAVCLLGTLAALATVEETVVREKAVESACSVIKSLAPAPASVSEHVVPMIQQLAKGDWFTSRVSVCGLLPTAYERLAGDPGSRLTLRSLFATLCADETPMVRRAAAKALGPLAAVTEREFVVSDLVPVFNALAADDQDSVRLLSIEQCVAFARVLPMADCQRYVLPLVRACACDKSWRVRNNVAKEFYPLSHAVGHDVTRTQLLSLFRDLLRDPEAEVRASAAKNLSGYAELVGVDLLIAELLPAIVSYVTAGGQRDAQLDPVQSVRVAVADALMDLPRRAGMSHEQTVSAILPVLLRLLHDESPDVRLRVLQALGKVAEAVGPQLLEAHVLPALVQLASDSLWRVRERVIDQLPLLAKCLGAPVFEDRLLPLYAATHQDQVHAVRAAAARVLQPIAFTLGASWAAAKLVPRLLNLYQTDGASYLQRITVLQGLRSLSTHRELVGLAYDLLPYLIGALSDDVPNVRFVAAECLRDVLAARVLDAAVINSQVRPALTQVLNTDEDPDVRYFSEEAMRLC